jgi:DNA-binding NtrC family response regulator
MPNLLIVDGDHFFIHSTKYFFDNDGYDVDVTQSHEEAIQMMSQKNFDVAICGTHLQSKTGFEVASMMKKINPEIKIIIVSASNNIVSMNSKDELVYDEYFQKPINLGYLRDSVTKMIGVAQTHS